MSRERALNAINEVMSDRIPQWDFPDNVLLAKKIASYDIWEDTERTTIDLLKVCDIDMTHCIAGGIAEWNFPLVRYYNEVDFIENEDTAAYLKAYQKKTAKPYRSMYDNLGMSCSGSFWGIAPTLAMKKYMFDSPEDVLEFNPLEHDSATLDERIEFFRNYYREKQELLGDDCLLIGWYYHTLFMWPVEIFGWENFMLAAMTDAERFKEILDQFWELSKRDLSAIAAVDNLPLIGCHDDLCSANGPMFPPEWYRTFIYDRYSEVSSIIRTAGKKTVFVCDGNVTALLPDIAATGFDGIAVDGQTDLTSVVKSFSGKIIVGGMKPAVVSHGTPEQIERMVQETVAVIKDEPGYFFQSSGMAGKTPIENIEHYQACIRKYGQR
ncbi:MAG: uroporphyrinogen decarboxylase family protein [Kiritimatiellales bacterium]